MSAASSPFWLKLVEVLQKFWSSAAVRSFVDDVRKLAIEWVIEWLAGVMGERRGEAGGLAPV